VGIYDSIMMEKLTRQQEVIVRKLLHYSKSEEFSQFILKTIEKHNWTRDILGDTVEFLTEEQEDLYESLGGGYTSEDEDNWGEVRFTPVIIFDIQSLNIICRCLYSE
jgi:hypothetical protein